MNDITSYVDELMRGQLVQLGNFIKKGMPDCDVVIVKLNNTDLKQFIYDSNITLDEIKDFFNYIESSKEKSSKKPEVETTLETEVKQENKKASNQVLTNDDYKRFVAAQRKKAMDTVIITITPNHPRDIEMGKTAETFFIDNQHFQVAKVVPFNVPCEVPKCVADNILEAMAPVYYKYSNEDSIILKKLGEYRMIPKYNVRIQDKSDFIK